MTLRFRDMFYLIYIYIYRKSYGSQKLNPTVFDKVIIIANKTDFQQLKNKTYILYCTSTCTGKPCWAFSCPSTIEQIIIYVIIECMSIQTIIILKLKNEVLQAIKSIITTVYTYLVHCWCFGFWRILVKFITIANFNFTQFKINLSKLNNLSRFKILLSIGIVAYPVCHNNRAQKPFFDLNPQECWRFWNPEYYFHEIPLPYVALRLI